MSTCRSCISVVARMSLGAGMMVWRNVVGDRAVSTTATQRHGAASIINSIKAGESQMAKPAKQQDADISEKLVVKLDKDILALFESIESHKGRYMNAAKREREKMQAVYEGLAARGIPQKAAKTHIQIVRLLLKAQGLMTDLDAENRKLVERMAKASKDKKQLSLFGDLPKQAKRFVEELRESTEDLSQQTAVGSA